MTLNRCPRCIAGRMFHDRDSHGAYVQCINCGHLIPLDGYDPEGKPPQRADKGRPRTSRLRGLTFAQRHR